MIDYQIKHVYVDNQLIMYKLFYWQKHNLTMRVSKKDNCIHVYVNKWYSQDVIDKFIKTYISKQHQHLQERKNNQKINSKANYLYLLDEKYDLQIVPTNKKRKYEVFNKKIYLQCKKSSDQEFLIKQLLLDYSERFIRPLFQKWLKKMNLTNVNLNFRWMVSRYGVCKTTKPYRVTLGLQSITNRIEVIEYLIVHELVHIFHHNHQQGFWNCVATYLPNWKSLDKELLKNNLEYLNLGNEK